MNLEAISHVVYEAMKTTVYVSMPSVGLGLLAGLLVSIIQAVTQIQEQTLTFVPKMVVVMFVVAITFPWMYHSLMNMTVDFWANIPLYAK